MFVILPESRMPHECVYICEWITGGYLQHWPILWDALTKRGKFSGLSVYERVKNCHFGP